MTRHTVSRLALLAAVLAPAPTWAAPVAGTADYTLTSTTGLPAPDPNATAPQVVFAVVPPGAIAPPVAADGTPGSPLTVLSGSTGFDPAQLVAALNNDTDAAGHPQQLFGLAFFGSGLAPGGTLHFGLDVGPGLSAPPALQIVSPNASSLSLTVDPGQGTTGGGIPPGSGSGSGVPTGNPEPLSLLIWSLLAGLGLTRARSLCRRAC